MTPFSSFLNDVCRSRGMLQKEVAYQIGVDPSYLSAMVRGRKGLPKGNFIQRLEKNLDLNEEERRALSEAVRFSQKLYRMPNDANPREHELVWKIFDSLGKLKPAQINLITEALKL